VTRTPFVLVQLRDEFVADAEGFNVPEGNTRRPIRRGCEGPPESTGRGIQEEKRGRTREAPTGS
jgi:hypothetical protein